MSNMSDLPQTIPTATDDELSAAPIPAAPRDGSGHPVDPEDRGPDWKEKIAEALEYDKEVLARTWDGFKEGREGTAPVEAAATSQDAAPEAPKDEEPDFVP
ncbi:MAG: hypothetical protein JNK60_10235 [Acidobacteria bacterium]|nr:hypothetical protein [Acidobacteriota bacterium]